MDEEELLEYENIVFGLDPFGDEDDYDYAPISEQELLVEQLRDSDGNRLPGCYRTLPVTIE